MLLLLDLIAAAGLGVCQDPQVSDSGHGITSWECPATESCTPRGFGDPLDYGGIWCSSANGTKVGAEVVLIKGRLDVVRSHSAGVSIQTWPSGRVRSVEVRDARGRATALWYYFPDAERIDHFEVASFRDGDVESVRVFQSSGADLFGTAQHHVPVVACMVVFRDRRGLERSRKPCNDYLSALE